MATLMETRYVAFSMLWPADDPGSMIVTENLKDFSAAVLSDLNMEAKSADAFIADTIALDEARAVAAIRRMRERFKKPEMTPAELLLVMEAAGLIETVDVLRPHVESL